VNIVDLLLHVGLGYLSDGSTEISSTWTKANKRLFSNFLCTTSPEASCASQGICFPVQESNCSFIVHTIQHLQLYCDIIYEDLLTLFKA